MLLHWKLETGFTLNVKLNLFQEYVRHFLQCDITVQVTRLWPLTSAVIFIKAPDGLRWSTRHLFSLQWRQTGIQSLSSASARHMKRNAPPISWNPSKREKTLHRFKTFSWSCYATEADGLWQEVWIQTEQGNNQRGTCSRWGLCFPLKPLMAKSTASPVSGR